MIPLEGHPRQQAYTFVIRILLLHLLQHLHTNTEMVHTIHECQALGADPDPTSVVDPDPDPVGSETFCRIRENHSCSTS